MNDETPTLNDIHGDDHVTAASLPADERSFLDRHFAYDSRAR